MACWVLGRNRRWSRSNDSKVSKRPAASTRTLSTPWGCRTGSASRAVRVQPKVSRPQSVRARAGPNSRRHGSRTRLDRVPARRTRRCRRTNRRRTRLRVEQSSHLLSRVPPARLPRRISLRSVEAATRKRRLRTLVRIRAANNEMRDSRAPLRRGSSVRTDRGASNRRCVAASPRGSGRQ